MEALLVCGVDEAGRGPLAGPVYAAAVILDRRRRIRGLADSKLLTAERRAVLAQRIKERAVAWTVASASVEEIDHINIFHASMLAMRRAVQRLGVRPDEVWVDGNRCPQDLGCPARAFVDGDALHAPISAASILAKTARDAELIALHQRYPQYGFDRHKGYATEEHLSALGRLGPCEIHRQSFYAIGVFREPAFLASWTALSEALRVRTYLHYCDAMKLSLGYGLAGARGGSRLAAARARLARFDQLQRRLKREYADVLSNPQTVTHAAFVAGVLRAARAQLRPGRSGRHSGEG